MANIQSGGVDVVSLTGKLYLTNFQTGLVHGVWSIVNLDTIPANFTDGIEDIVNHKITPGLAGLYAICARVNFYNIIADKPYAVKITKNAGFSCVALMYREIGNVAYSVLEVSASLCYLSPTDYVQLQACSWAGADTVEMEGSEVNTYLSMWLVK